MKPSENGTREPAALAQRFDAWLTEQYQQAVEVHSADSRRDDRAALAFSGPRWAAFLEVLNQWLALQREAAAALTAPSTHRIDLGRGVWRCDYCKVIHVPGEVVTADIVDEAIRQALAPAPPQGETPPQETLPTATSAEKHLDEILAAQTGEKP